MPVGFWRLALLWLPAGIVVQAIVRFLPAKEASSKPGMEVAAVLMSASSLAVLAPTACCCLWRLGYRPSLGRKRVDQKIATAAVMAVLIPHGHTKKETMRWVRQHIGAVTKWAVAQGYRGDSLASDAISTALPNSGTHLRLTRPGRV